MKIRTFRLLVLPAAIVSMAACTGSFTGPIEVTRFVSEQSSPVTQGTIAIDFPEETSNLTARRAFIAAVSEELSQLGYTIVPEGSEDAEQTATIRTSRNSLAAGSSRGPVSVGAGVGTGTFGTGANLGVGINLGGARSRPNVLTELSVRISGTDGASIWEGRAQQPTSLKSPYSEVELSAQALAGALFKDFPGGNGETVTVEVNELQPQ